MKLTLNLLTALLLAPLGRLRYAEPPHILIREALQHP